MNRSLIILSAILLAILIVIGVSSFLISLPDPPKKPNTITHKYFTSRNDFKLLPLICQYETAEMYGYTEDSCTKYDIGDTLKNY